MPCSELEYFQVIANGVPDVTLAGAVIFIVSLPLPKREESQGAPRVAMLKSPHSTMTMTMMNPTIARVFETRLAFGSANVCTVVVCSVSVFTVSAIWAIYLHISRYLSIEPGDDSSAKSRMGPTVCRRQIRGESRTREHARARESSNNLRTGRQGLTHR